MGIRFKMKEHFGTTADFKVLKTGEWGQKNKTDLAFF